MDNITINDEGLMEVSPTASRDATMSFIDTYRQLQGENNAQIGNAAHALGSDLTAQYGGLHGPSEYIKSRYQTPQTESRIAGLKSAAQLSALNQIMQNEQDKWKNRYSNAQRNYQKRNYDSNKAAQAAALAASEAKKGDVDVKTYNQLTGENGSTLQLSNEDWASQNLPEGANRITRVSANGAVANGRPAYYNTADNTDGSMRDTVVSGYGIPTNQAVGASDIGDLWNITHLYHPLAQLNKLIIGALK